MWPFWLSPVSRKLVPKTEGTISAQSGWAQWSKGSCSLHRWAYQPSCQYFFWLEWTYRFIPHASLPRSHVFLPYLSKVCDIAAHIGLYPSWNTHLLGSLRSGPFLWRAPCSSRSGVMGQFFPLYIEQYIVVFNLLLGLARFFMVVQVVQMYLCLFIR